MPQTISNKIEYYYKNGQLYKVGGGNDAVEVTVDDALSSSSENPVQNKVITAALNDKVDAVTGKGLSTNDFTSAYKDAVDANTTARHTHSNKSILDATTASYTTAEQTKLAGITQGSVATGDTGFVTGGAVKTYVDTAINNLPEPMVFKGTLGTGGTITSLPSAATANEGFTYKVITAGTYASQSAKVGDVFVSNGSAWVLIPAGDDVEDTWRQINVNGTSLLGTGISSGAVNFKSGTNVTVSGSGNEITISSTYETATESEIRALFGNVAPTPTLISFTIAGTSYQAEEGMTWAEWVASEYNTGSFVVKNGYVYENNSSSYHICIQDTDIPSTDQIIENTSYVLSGQPTGGGDGPVPII